MNRTISLLIALALVNTVLSAQQPRVAPADLVLLNGKVVTLESEKPAQAVAILGTRKY